MEHSPTPLSTPITALVSVPAFIPLIQSVLKGRCLEVQSEIQEDTSRFLARLETESFCLALFQPNELKPLTVAVLARILHLSEKHPVLVVTTNPEHLSTLTECKVPVFHLVADATAILERIEAVADLCCPAETRQTVVCQATLKKHLTRRQVEVLLDWLECRSVKESADRLFIAAKTVSAHRNDIGKAAKKLGLTPHDVFGGKWVKGW